MPSTGILSFEDWAKSQGSRNWIKEYADSFGGDGAQNLWAVAHSGKDGLNNFIQGLYNNYARKATSDNLVAKSEAYGDKMGLLGDALQDPSSSSNQFNLRNMSALLNAQNPNYSEIAASQGVSGSIASMQNMAAKRQAGLLTNANFGSMMNENKKSALGYYGAQSQSYSQAQAANQGLLSLEYQDKWKQAELKEQQREYEDQKGSFLGDLLNVGLGIGSTFLGNWAGSRNTSAPSNRSGAGIPWRPSYNYAENPMSQSPTDPYSIGGIKLGTKWNPLTGRYE